MTINIGLKEKLMSDKFCSMPWIGMFYHTEKAKVCCASQHKSSLSPIEFRKSDFVKQLKKDFLDSKQPESCKDCWDLEDVGMRSVRHNLMSSREHQTINDFNLEDEYDLEFIELRVSNLCNFSCSICNAESSTQLGKEITKFPKLLEHFWADAGLVEISDSNHQEILSFMPKMQHLHLTGGEPMLIKQYYELLDLLISNGYSNKMLLQITTNGSVLNSNILNRFDQFKTTRIVVSIDAVNEKAEYQRYGTDWAVVKENCFTYARREDTNQHGNLFNLVINTAISAYTVLGFSELASFMADLYEINPTIHWMGSLVFGRPQINCTVLDKRFRKKALIELKSAESIIAPTNFEPMKKQISALINILSREDNYGDFNSFVEFTNNVDANRKKSFYDVFGYKLVDDDNFCPAPMVLVD